MRNEEKKKVYLTLLTWQTKWPYRYNNNLFVLFSSLLFSSLLFFRLSFFLVSIHVCTTNLLANLQRYFRIGHWWSAIPSISSSFALLGSFLWEYEYFNCYGLWLLATQIHLPQHMVRINHCQFHRFDCAASGIWMWVWGHLH